MAPQRTSKGEASSPDSLAVTGGGGAPTDRLYDVSQRMARVEASVTYLEGHADEARKKLDTISEQITAARASFNTTKYFLGAICLAVWGIIAMWVKHRFSW